MEGQPTSQGTFKGFVTQCGKQFWGWFLEKHLHPLDVFLLRCASSGLRKAVMAADQNVVKKMSEKGLVKSCAGYGTVSVMQWLLNDQQVRPDKDDEEIIMEAFENGNTEMFEYLFGQDFAVCSDRDICEDAPTREMVLLVARLFRMGESSVIEQLRLFEQRSVEETLEQMVRETGFPTENNWAFYMTRFEKLVMAKRYDLLKMVHFRKSGNVWHSSLCANATKLGSLEMLQWLHQEGCPWDKSTCNAAARQSDPKFLKFALEKNCPYDVDQLYWNVFNYQSWACFKYLQSIGIPLNAASVMLRFAVAEQEREVFQVFALMKVAAGHSLNEPIHLSTEALRILLQLGAEWRSEICERAAEANNFEVLKYAHENGCPWEVETICSIAALSGSLVCLRYAHENGCRIDAQTFLNGIQSGSLRVVRYLLESSRVDVQEELCWKELPCMKAAEVSWKMLELVRSSGCPWNVAVVSSALEERKYHCVRWAVENGCPYDFEEDEEDGCGDNCNDKLARICTLRKRTNLFVHVEDLNEGN
jgi:hypothetical protein